MFELAHAEDAGLPEEERHLVHDLDMVLNYWPDPDESPIELSHDERVAQRQRELDDMNRAAEYMNRVMGGDG